MPDTSNTPGGIVANPCTARWSPGSRRVTIAMAINATAGMATVVLAILAYQANGSVNDFYNYYHAGQLVSEGQFGAIYDYVLNLGGTSYIYRYFPAFAACMAPLARLPYDIAFGIFSCASLAFAALTAMEVLRITRRLGRDESALVLFLLLPFSLWTYLMGQNITIATYLVALSSRCMMEARWKKSGFFLGISMVIKPISAFIATLVMAWLVVSRKPVALARFFLAFALALLPDALLFLSIDGLLASFIGSSIAGIDMRPVALSYSAASFFYYVFDVHYLFILVPGFVIMAWLLLARVKRVPFEQACFAITGAGVLLHFACMIDIWQSQLAFLVILTPMLAPARENRLNAWLVALSIATFVMSFMFDLRIGTMVVITINHWFLAILAMSWFYWYCKLPLSWLRREFR